ncbi:hypothetical protein [Serratia proteamaculans]|uniref:Uncharacterized protein n=1 Tax=Serratia proteamaculans TaxID=28151 RepID=A0A5Q2V450_SERPR|nr:hypothetical protein [Serratia proteamaculans]QGH60197.1 hypothetical protein GHV41_04785 [Serratia proteamaculans]
MINKIELNRSRIALAYLDYCQRHYGGKWADVVITKRKGVRVDLTQESIEALMKEFIENMIRAEFGIAAVAYKLNNPGSQLLQVVP